MQHKLQTILGRAAAPFCLFSAVLLGSLGLIRVTVVPFLTRVEINGEQQQVSALLQKHAALTAELTEAETERSALVLPVQDPRYQELRAEQQTQQRLSSVVAIVDQLAQESKQEGKPVVVVQEAALDYGQRTLHLRGDVRNAGASSLSVLAWFIDSLRTVPLLIDTPTPPFKREQDPYIGQYSPFDIVIPLRIDE